MTTATTLTGSKALKISEALQRFPAELRALPNWVGYRDETDEKGKTSHAPYRLTLNNNGRHASSKNAKDWVSLSDALAQLGKANGRYNGLSLAIILPYVGIDLDGVRNPGTGEIVPWAFSWVRKLNSFTEVSPSGDGLHIWGRIKRAWDRPGFNASGIEVYSRLKFLTVTGRHLESTPLTVNEIDPELLDELHEFARQRQQQIRHIEARSSAKDGKPCHLDTSDSGEDWALVGGVVFAMRKAGEEISAESVETKLAHLYPERYAERNEKKGDRTNSEGNNVTYFGYTVERWLEQHPSVLFPPLMDEDARFATAKASALIQAQTGHKDVLAQDIFPAATQPEQRAIFRTDLGNSFRFVEQHEGKVRHCAAIGWLHWDGKRWKRDSRKKVIGLMKQTAISIMDEANTLALDGEGEEAQKMFKWAMISQSATRIEAALRLAESDLAVSVDADDLDHDPMLLNLLNGTLDLRTMELRPHNKADNITKLCPISYVVETKHPQFDRFINRILPDAEIRGFVQRWFGYCLTGDNAEQAVFIAYGEGANGKSQLLELFRKLLGTDYAARGTFDTFKLSSHGETRNDLARLRGIRLVTISESGEGVILDEAMIKDLTGGEAISARFLYKEFFDFVPEFKLTFATNYKPDIHGQDYAIWRRVCLVPFAVTIPEEEREDNIHERLLREEASGILNWALEGLRDRQRIGLAPPKAILAATQEYRDEQDLIGHFLADRCEIDPDLSKPRHSVTAAELYRRYNEWAKDAGYRPVSQKRLGQNLARRRFKSARDSRGVRIWQGIRLKG